MADSSLDIKMNDLKLTDSPTPALVPDQTPSETYASTFEPITPPLDPFSPSATADQEREVEELLEHDVSSLKSADVKADPILASLARQQSRPVSQASLPRQNPTGAPAFKARPAPVMKQGVTPRMTKSAALRQGLDWNAISGSKSAATDSTNKAPTASQPFESGRPFTSLSVSNIAPRENRSSILRTGGAPNIAIPKKDYAAQALINKANEKEERDRRRKSVALPASLTAPSSMMPRGNRSSMLRAGGAPVPLMPKKDYAAQALINKANEKEERDRRRKSVALPASLGAPSTAPRQNRSSELRTGVPALPSTRALAVTTAANVDQSIKSTLVNPKATLARRASMGVKSLGAPSIAPRLNKVALLRAPALGSAASQPGSAPSEPRSTTAHGGSSASSRPSHIRAQSTSSASKSVKTPVSPVGPKPTKSSLLRAGLGAKILARGV